MLDLVIGVETGEITVLTDSLTIFERISRLEFSSSGALIRSMTEAGETSVLIDGISQSSLNSLDRSPATEATIILVGQKAALETSSVPINRID